MTARLPDTIEHLRLDALIPYARNSRTHSPAQIDQVAASIAEFGFTNPVLIDNDGGIIAGHGRVMAARQLGLDCVPCIRLGHLTEAQRRAYVIADNKLALNAGWDADLLALELRDLAAMDFDLSLTGFDAGELDDLLAGLDDEPGPGEGADDVPSVQDAPVSKPGDVWKLGPHRVMCGDSTRPADVARLMAGACAQLLHADPPYGMGKEADGVANDNLYGEKLDAFQMAWWGAFRPSLADNASAYIWGNAPDLWRLWYRGGLADAERITVRNEIVWRKSGGVQGERSNTNRSFAPSGERCLFLMLGAQEFSTNADQYWDGWEPLRAYLAGEAEKMGWGPKDIRRITGVGMFSHWFTRSQWTMIPEKHYNALQAAAQGAAFLRPWRGEHDSLRGEHDRLRGEHDRLRRAFYDTRAYFDNTHDAMTDVWDFAPLLKSPDRHGHATVKPVEMMARVMRSSLPPGGLCVEPFGGSGSTLMGAEATGRTCCTMELQEKYVDVIVRRWQNYTGQRAVHADAGQPFPLPPEARA